MARTTPQGKMGCRSEHQLEVLTTNFPSDRLPSPATSHGRDPNVTAMQFPSRNPLQTPPDVAPNPPSGTRYSDGFPVTCTRCTHLAGWLCRLQNPLMSCQQDQASYSIFGALFFWVFCQVSSWNIHFQIQHLVRLSQHRTLPHSEDKLSCAAWPRFLPWDLSHGSVRWGTEATYVVNDG